MSPYSHKTSAEQGPTKTEIGWNLPFSWFDFKQCNATRATTFISTLFWLINLISHNQGLKNCKIRQIGWKASLSTIKIRDWFHLGRLVATVNKGSQLKQRFTSIDPRTRIKADHFNKGKLSVFLLLYETQKGKLVVSMQGICPWCFLH